MDRRQFLKMIGLAAAAVAAPWPIPVRAAYPNFDPSEEYGDFVFVTEWITDGLLELVKTRFEPQIADTIPLEYRDKIEWVAVQPKSKALDPLAQRGTIGWIYRAGNPGRL